MRGFIRNRGKNTWQIIYDGPRINGKRKQQSSTVKGTKKVAEEKLTSILASMGKGVHVGLSKQTLGDFLNNWITSREGKLSPTTVDGYRTILRAHINRTRVESGGGFIIGQKPLQDVHWQHVEWYYNSYRYVWDKDVGLFALPHRRLSERTLLHHHTFLRKALRDAVKKEAIVKNPMDSVEAPSPTKAQIEAFPQEDNASLINLFDGQTRTMVMFALATGLRRSEILGLKWDKVDQSEVVISHALVKSGKTVVLKGPKTKTSARRITIPSSFVAELRTHKAKQAQHQLAVGEAYEDQGFVFAKFDGSPLHPDKFSKDFKTAVTKTRFSKLDVHGLRHCHASQLIKAGINIKTISERLGHSTIVITLDTYGHLLPGMDSEAANVINASLTGC